MKVGGQSWQQIDNSSIYRAHSSHSEKDSISEYEYDSDSFETLSEDEDSLLSTLKSMSQTSSKDSQSNYKMKSSGPSNSVGELAAMLSRAESLMDVQQVMSKAMRALADLKMGSISAEGKEAKKFAQQIKRMEKLIKRIQKKMKHLSKEEGLENQRKRAQKNAQVQKEKELRQELRARRNKRRREERRYALKEMSEDRKNANSELMSSMENALASPTPELSSVVGAEGAVADSSADFSADFSGMEGMSIDIMV